MKQWKYHDVQPDVFPRFKKIVAYCALPVATCLQAAENSPPVPDVLVYNDGDRVSGRLVAREGDMLVFRSMRFGELRVPAAQAAVISALAPAVAPSAPQSPDPGAPAKPRGFYASAPYELARWLRDVFGPWKGRFSVSSQVTSDANERTDVVAEVFLKRKWEKDEVELSTRYDYSKSNVIDTTDTFRGNGSWRHSLPRRLFSIYRPSVEWNRASTINGVSSDYVLVQQEVGLGVKAVDREKWKLRVGVAENFFSVWDLTTDVYRNARVESLFLETDITLPWRITMTERAVYFYSLATRDDGWENQFEVSKKLTETLSLSLRHESRYNNPNVQSEDYSLLRFALGLDF